MVVLDKGEIVFDGPLKEVIKSKNLNLYGVSVPPIIGLQNYLKEDGLIFNEFCLNVKDFVKQLKVRLMKS